jgi:TonB family protein
MRIVVLLALLLFGTAAVAQTGPAPPKVVVAGMTLPPPVPPPETKMPPGGYSAEVELETDAEGRVPKARIVKSSGDAKLDLLLTKYYRKWRVVPAIDAGGRPTTGVVRVAYRKAEKSPPRSEPLPPANARPGAEADRVERMSCADFVWEYDLMQSIAGKHAIDTEELLRTAFGLYLARHPLKGDDLNRLMWARRPAIADSVTGCRSAPSRKFWSEVYEPTLARHFKKGSRPPKQWPPPKKRKSSR